MNSLVLISWKLDAWWRPWRETTILCGNAAVAENAEKKLKSRMKAIEQPRKRRASRKRTRTWRYRTASNARRCWADWKSITIPNLWSTLPNMRSSLTSSFNTDLWWVYYVYEVEISYSSRRHVWLADWSVAYSSGLHWPSWFSALGRIHDWHPRCAERKATETYLSFV